MAQNARYKIKIPGVNPRPGKQAPAARYRATAHSLSSTVVNHSLVAMSYVWPPRQDLPWREWATLNHFRSGQGRCVANLVRWKQSADPWCSCDETQTLSHIVNDCVTTCFPGGLTALHLPDEATVQ